MRPILTFLILLFAFPASGIGQVVVEDSAEIGDTEIPYLHYQAQSPVASLIWFEPHYGEFRQLEVAQALARQGFEVWQANWFDTFFLPRAYSSLSEMDGNVIAAFAHWVNQRSGKPVYFVGAGRGTVAALNGLATPDNEVKGLIALNPSIYLTPPEPFQQVSFVDSAKHCATPVMILQPQMSTRIWWMEEVERVLKSGGAQVQSRFLPKVRDEFWQRPDLNKDEIARKQQFHQDIIDAIHALEPKHEE